MTVDCILKFWYKRKGYSDSFYCEAEICDAEYYKGSDYETKWELQIVSIDEKGDYWEVLNSVTIDQNKPNSTFYVSFNKLTYAYKPYLNQIFCITTRLEI